MIHSISGIAFVRFLCVKFPNIMASHEKVINGAVTVMSLLLSATFTILHGLQYKGVKDNGSLIDICDGLSKDFVVIRFQYQFANQKVNYKEGLVMLSAALFILLELICYIITYRFLFKHDQSLSNVLSKEKIKRRVRKNVINLAGHGIRFALKMLNLFITVLMHISIMKNEDQIFMRAYIMSSYGISAILYVTFSDKLKDEIVPIFKQFASTSVSILDRIWNFFYSV